MHQTPLHELFNLRWYIQHLIDENEDENENPLCHEHWMKQTNWKFSKYVIHHKHSMTTEQLKKKPFKQIINIQHEKLDTEKVESTKDEEQYTTSSEISEQDSASDTTIDDTSTEDEEESEAIETLQVHNVCNKSTHDEDESSEDEDITEIESIEENGLKLKIKKLKGS